MESNIAFHFLHGLMDMTIQDSYRSKTLEIRKRLSAIRCSPTPLRIDSPKRNVSKNYYRSTARKVFHVSLQPFKLILAKEAQTAVPLAQHIDQANKMYTV